LRVGYLNHHRGSIARQETLTSSQHGQFDAFHIDLDDAYYGAPSLDPALIERSSFYTHGVFSFPALKHIRYRVDSRISTDFQGNFPPLLCESEGEYFDIPEIVQVNIGD